MHEPTQATDAVIDLMERRRAADPFETAMQRLVWEKDGLPPKLCDHIDRVIKACRLNRADAAKVCRGAARRLNDFFKRADTCAVAAKAMADDGITAVTLAIAADAFSVAESTLTAGASKVAADAMERR